MLKKIFKIIGYFILAISSLLILVIGYFNLPVKNKIDKANLGVTFSYRYSQDIGLDWRENYLAIMDDLGAKRIRIPVYWDWVEKSEGKYDFSDIDWQIDEAGKRNVEIILVVGKKVPRWPECFVPEWAKNDEGKREESLIKLVETTVERYKDKPQIKYWQVENEPFLDFGICCDLNVALLDEEIETVRKTDPTREIIVTDSGELSTWIPAAKRADVFGTTMYRNVYKEGWGYYVYPLGPRFFLTKRWIIDKFVDQDKAIVVELQGEPWVSGWTVHESLEEQFNSMNEKKLSDNVEYAKKSGFDTVYIWGSEWWYWLKKDQNYPIVWDEAKKIFNENK